MLGQIVLLACASPHREAAFEACHFLIDRLKTKTPFWKLGEKDCGAEWTNTRESVDEADAKWD